MLMYVYVCVLIYSEFELTTFLLKSSLDHCCFAEKLKPRNNVPEVIIAQEAFASSLFNGDVDRSCSVHGRQQVPDVDGLVGG